MANLGYAALLMIASANELEIDRMNTFGVLAALLIIGSASIDLNDSPKVPKILTYLGDASYSIFLVHSPIVSAITKVLQKANLGKYYDGFFAPALVALITVFAGCIFYSLIEKPLTVYLRKNVVEKMNFSKAPAS